MMNLIKLVYEGRGIFSLKDMNWSNIIDPNKEYSLDISGNKLINLKGCPSNIKMLNCSNNSLISLEGCPINLIELDCSTIN